MKKIFLSVLLSLFLLLSFAYSTTIPTLNINLDEKKLADGELQTFVETLETKEKGGKKRVIGVIMINANQSEVWKIIKNWDVYGEFVPGLKYYETKYKKTFPDQPNFFRSYIEGYIKIPVPFIRKTYTLDVTFDKSNYFIQWQLIDNNKIYELEKELNIELATNSRVIQTIEGFSYLKPYDNSQKTIIFYAPVVEITIPVPQRVERFLSGTIMKGFMEAIKNRAESNQKKTIISEQDE